MSHERPQWWQKNAALRERMGLPEYEPSRLTDGTYVHEVLDEIEAKYDAQINLISEDPSYPSVWVFRLDGSDCVAVERHRDEKGNNVYQISASELREQIVASIES
ncbi:hypothetical protein NDI54_13785 [Haloarcula sp. S1AR25-5A]|uniref:Uncharacterized protein n=1 Tax=Haloarcula terrestris TaxID=2950533 RepID=A0AAE4EZV1_9EURY|nr:hypothetical protein [Haloarcula terrestris]MDS0222414.1 hypothetical protein [Haloarcula terrestris]